MKYKIILLINFILFLAAIGLFVSSPNYGFEPISIYGLGFNFARSIVYLGAILFLVHIINPTEFESKGLKFKKILYYSLLFISIFIIGSIYASLSKESVKIDSVPSHKMLQTDKNPTNDKIIKNMYRNIKYNFSIKFPAGWKMEIGDGINVVQKASLGNSTISVMIQQFILAEDYSITSIEDSGSAENYINVVMEDVKKKFDDVIVIDYGETKINNEPSYWVEYSAVSQIFDNKIEMTYLVHFFAKGDTIYSINAATLSSEYMQIKPIFLKSVASFLLEKY